MDIIYITYNSEKWIEKCFHSLLTLDYNLKELKLYVVDNASRDHTVEMLKKMQEECAKWENRIYADNGGASTITYNGTKTHALDMNLTATTHLPSIRMIVTLRLEAALVRRSQRLSEYNGQEYAFNVDEDRNPTGGSIYDGNSYTAIWPIAYLDRDGVRHPFTDAERSNTEEFGSLLLRSSNTYTYNEDGYDPYFSANLSITKEIGDHVSISFYANNFTNSRPFLRSYATGIKSVFTPAFYYGLTVRLKF